MTKATSAKLHKIVTFLSANPMTAAELSDALFCGRPRVGSLLRMLRDDKCVYICRYNKVSGALIPVYEVGDLPDARPPRAMTVKKKNKRYWTRLINDPDRYLTVTRTKRVSRIKVPTQSNNWLSALTTKGNICQSSLP